MYEGGRRYWCRVAMPQTALMAHCWAACHYNAKVSGRSDDGRAAGCPPTSIMTRCGQYSTDRLHQPPLPFIHRLRCCGTRDGTSERGAGCCCWCCCCCCCWCCCATETETFGGGWMCATGALSGPGGSPRRRECKILIFAKMHHPADHLPPARGSSSLIITARWPGTADDDSLSIARKSQARLCSENSSPRLELDEAVLHAMCLFLRALPGRFPVPSVDLSSPRTRRPAAPPAPFRPPPPPSSSSSSSPSRSHSPAPARPADTASIPIHPPALHPSSHAAPQFQMPSLLTDIDVCTHGSWQMGERPAGIRDHHAHVRRDGERRPPSQCAVALAVRNRGLQCPTPWLLGSRSRLRAGNWCAFLAQAVRLCHPSACCEQGAH
ncbi:hypothetical protein CERZMDRAFT_84146 [Cercospora zeae-maydis SCOH1-5]|uniref:Uncharacterized protein n=1 Tax=Cercospora zeae-maydis SCOH1-5 TaxID=717836 RepID=A0A6A6FIP2_9PEZI|nr:hypothetical protein CERZMDRAFT_84146 [Cercospora zeae-maydis SCOH1-5]